MEIEKLAANFTFSEFFCVLWQNKKQGNVQKLKEDFRVYI